MAGILRMLSECPANVKEKTGQTVVGKQGR